MAHNESESWQAIVASSLGWQEAHATFGAATADLPAPLRARRVAGFPHSVWELVEHIRVAQADLAEFMENPAYAAPAWPDDYWPDPAAVPDDAEWNESLAAVRRGRERLAALAARRDLDLTTRIPWGDGQTFLRTILVAVDHTAYHVGQIVAVRRILGAWG